MRSASILLLVLLALTAALGWFVTRSERVEIDPAGPELAAAEAVRPKAAVESSAERVELEPDLDAGLDLENESTVGTAPHPAGPCRVRVIDAGNSLPVAGARVELILEAPLDRMFQMSKDVDVEPEPIAPDLVTEAPFDDPVLDEEEELDLRVTDADGIVVIEAGEPGPWIWATEGARFGAVRRSTEARELTLVLHRPETLELEVRDATGAIAAGVQVLELSRWTDFITDASGRISLPLVPYSTGGSADSLEFVLPLVDSSPRRHTVRLGSKLRSPLRFELGPNGTLELLAASEGRRVVEEGLSIRWGCVVSDLDGSERTWFWERRAPTGAVQVLHVGPGRALWGRASLAGFRFPRVELPALERPGELAVRTIPLLRTRAQFRGIAVDESGEPLRERHIELTTIGKPSDASPPTNLRCTGWTSPTGEFVIHDNHGDDGSVRDWEPGDTFEFRLSGPERGIRTAQGPTPQWTIDPDLIGVRLLDFGVVTFRCVPVKDVEWK